MPNRILTRYPNQFWKPTPIDLVEASLGLRRHAFLELLNDWVGLSAVMNEMCRSVGQADFYPFVLSGPVVTKLHFIHCLVDEQRR